MDVLADDTTNETTVVSQEYSRAGGLVITVELIGYVALFGLALALYLAAIGDVPITPGETRDAIAAYAPVWLDEPVITDSPAVFWAQRVGFTLLGSSEGAARVLTALVGALLVLAPLFFRNLFGPTRTFLFALLLTFSPILMLGARFSHPAVWSMAFASLSMGLAWRYWSTREAGYATGAIVAFMSLVLLSEPGGIILAIMVVGATLVATLLTSIDTQNEDDSSEFLSNVRNGLLETPVINGLLFGILTVVVVSTGFMTFFGGLSGVGEVITGVFTTMAAPPTTNEPLFPVLLASIYYELFLWVFGILGIILIAQRNDFTFVERLLVVWFVLGVAASLGFRGADAAHALWLTAPLAGLSSYAVTRLFTSDRTQMILAESQDNEDLARLFSVTWGRWLLAFTALGLFAMLAVHLQVVARAILTVEGGSFAALIQSLQGSTPVPPALRVSFLWLFITVLFLIIGGFLAASIWGRKTTLQGLALGLLMWGLINGLSMGWNAAVFEIDNPAQPWQVTAPDQEVVLLGETFTELTLRETQGHPELPVTIITDTAAGLTDDGLIAWLLRDFQNVRFVPSIEAARTDPVVITVDLFEPPNLGGSYVGQRFVIEQTWNAAQMQGFDFLAWWFQRRSRFEPVEVQVVTLWVRQDIYDSNPVTAPGVGFHVDISR